MPAPERTRPMLKLRAPQRARRLLEELSRRFPAVFSKPILLGVDKELRALLQPNEPFGAAGAVLKSALAYWTGRRGYQEALAAGMVRYGLNGEIAGEVADT